MRLDEEFDLIDAVLAEHDKLSKRHDYDLRTEDMLEDDEEEII